MMKKTQWIELFHNIKSTFVSFVALILFVTLATGLFTGIKWTANSLDLSVEAAYSRDHFHHFVLSYPYGFDALFINSLIQSNTVDEAEGYYETYRNIRKDSDKYRVRIISLTPSIDRPYCVSGFLPEQRGDIAVNRNWAEENGIRIGDILEFEDSADLSGFYLNAISEGNPEKLSEISDKSSELLADSFRVTALIDSAEYMGRYADTNGMSPNSSLPIKTVMYVADQSFDKNAFCGYSKVVVRAKELDGLATTSDEYKERSEKLKKCIETSAQAYASQKNSEMKAAAESAFPFEQIFSALDHIGGYEAFVAPRSANGTFVGIHYLTDTFGKLQYSLVSLFVIIELLVCYSVVSRLVYDQRVLTGTKKALGFFTADILKPFLIYAGIAITAGIVCGILLGRFIIEPVAVGSVGNTYRFYSVVYCLNIREVLLFALIQTVLIIAATLIACVSISRKPPLKLLNGDPPAFRSHRWIEKIPFWNRLSLMRRTIIINCLNDHRRVFATLIGIIGCTALVVCSLSGYSNIYGSFDLTMDKVCLYDTEVHFSGNTQTKKELISMFDQTDAQYAEARHVFGTTQTENGNSLITDLFAATNDDFYDFMHLNDVDSGTEKQAEHGAWINVGYAEHFGAEIGDTVLFTDTSGQTHEFSIEGFYDYYLMNYRIILPAGLYEEEFGEPCESNMFMLRTAETEFEKIRPTALDLEDDLTISDFYNEKKDVFDSIAGIAGITLIMYLILSVVLAFLLLLNLFTMFVWEKKTELITLMINGFSRKNAEQYISTDTKFLMTVGIAAGVALGIFMGRISLDSFNNDAAYFLYRFDIGACFAGIVFSSVLTYMMCRLALRKVKQFRLADINKM